MFIIAVITSLVDHNSNYTGPTVNRTQDLALEPVSNDSLTQNRLILVLLTRA